MFKFDIIHPQSQYAFCFYNQSNNYRLFEIENGKICIYKENNKNESFCQQSFYYNGLQNAFCKKFNFTPKRITAVQVEQYEEQPFPVPPKPRQQQAEIYIADYDYEKTADGDLNFREGDVLRVLSVDENGWAQAVNFYGEQGTVPLNYLIKP